MSTINVKPQGTPTTELLGAGAVYVGGVLFDWANNPGSLLGVTKGGSSFTDNAEFRRREADGDYMPVKNATDMTQITPQLTTNALKITTGNLETCFAGMSTHVWGTFRDVATPLANGGATIGDSTIDIDGGSASETILKGDVFSIGAYTYTATADATASTGAVTVSVTPTVQATIADDAVVVFSTMDIVTRKFDLTSSYVDALYWVGQTRAGKDIAIELRNVLADVALSWSPTKDEEIVISPTFTAHADSSIFDISNEGTYPYKILFEV